MLEISHLFAAYDESRILHDINLRLGENERVAVLGRNGAGKTTLLKALMNAGPGVTGGISWDGTRINDLQTHMRARLGIALVPEDRRIYGHLTVSENIRLSRYGARPGTKPLAIDDVLKRLPMLDPLRDQMARELSGGQQQMLTIARALASRPRLLLLDEPTEGLAPVLVEKLVRDIIGAADEVKCGLLLCEQNLWFAKKCTDRVYILDTGSIAFAGSWDEFNTSGETVMRHLTL